MTEKGAHKEARMIGVCCECSLFLFFENNHWGPLRAARLTSSGSSCKSAPDNWMHKRQLSCGSVQEHSLQIITCPALVRHLCDKHLFGGPCERYPCAPVNAYEYPPQSHHATFVSSNSESSLLWVNLAMCSTHLRPISLP